MKIEMPKEINNINDCLKFNIRDCELYLKEFNAANSVCQAAIINSVCLTINAIFSNSRNDKCSLRNVLNNRSLYETILQKIEKSTTWRKYEFDFEILKDIRHVYIAHLSNEMNNHDGIKWVNKYKCPRLFHILFELTNECITILRSYDKLWG